MSRARYARRQGQYTDPDFFAERIPFAATRNYVWIVQRNARIYRYLYEGHTIPDVDGRSPSAALSK